jgi:hypothetical protein
MCCSVLHMTPQPLLLVCRCTLLLLCLTLVHARRPLQRAQNLNPFNDQGTAGFRYWEEAELTDLAASVGLGSYQRIRSRMFILFSVTKPGTADV